MAYTHKLFSSINAVDLEEWQSVLAGADLPYMDPRFIRAAERAFSDEADIRYAVFYDAAGRPAAVAGLHTCYVDFEHLTANRQRKAVRVLKRFLPGLSNFKLTYNALPVATGDSSLHLSPEADPQQVLPLLDQVQCELATEHGARWIAMGAFSPAECRRLDSLEQLGYVKCNGLPNVYAAAGYRDFDDYCAKIKSSKRYTINRSRKKFDALGLRTVHVSGRDGGGQLYTDEVHKLFEDVADDKPRLLNMPASIFRELAREMPDESVFTYIYKDDRIVAQAFSICTPQSFNQLALGFDYEVNSQCDLLFNLFFQVVDCAYRRNSPRIVTGQTTDTFKLQKLSGVQEPRYIFVKSLRKRLGARLLKYYARRTAALETAAVAQA